MSKHTFSDRRLGRALAFIQVLYDRANSGRKTRYPKVEWQADQPLLTITIRNNVELGVLIKNRDEFQRLRSNDRALAEEVGIIYGQLQDLGLWRSSEGSHPNSPTAKTYTLSLNRDYETAKEQVSEAWRFAAKNKRPAKQDWGGAPVDSKFYGRITELETLHTYLKENAKIIVITGIAGQGKSVTAARFLKGGNGKTDLALKLARTSEGEFDYIIWRSLKNYPRVETILSDCIKFISDQNTINLSNDLHEQRQQLLAYLSQKRCLLILDNAETVIADPRYVELFDHIASTKHKSCLVLTTRQIPTGLSRLYYSGLGGAVKILHLKGIDWESGKEIAKQYGKFSATQDQWKEFIEVCLNGNPLAIELAAIHVQNKFKGTISQFLAQPKKDFHELREYLLDSIFNDLGEKLKRVVFWLAINRKPVSSEELHSDFPFDKEEMQKALNDLVEDSTPKLPIERSEQGYSLQEVLLEYFTEHFIEKVLQELTNVKQQPSNIEFFDTFWLTKATTAEYVRESQVRFIVKPILDRISKRLGSKKPVEEMLVKLLGSFKDMHSEHKRVSGGYIAGNIINMLICLRDGEKLYGLDFSGLPVRQAYLAEAVLHNVNFSNTDLSQSVFRQVLSSALAIAVSSDGKIFAIGDAQNDIHIWRTTDYQKCGTCKGHEDWVRSIAISKDGKTLISGSEDKTVKIWDLDDPFDDEVEVPCLYTFSECGAKVWCVATSSDSKFIACGSDDGTIRFWVCRSDDGTTKFRNKKKIALFATRKEHQNRIRSIAFHPHKPLAASSGEDGLIKIWDLELCQCTKTLKAKSDSTSYHVGCVMFSPDGSVLASGDNESTVRLWDIDSGQCTGILAGHTNSIISLAFSPDSQILASSSWDTTIRLWKVDAEESTICIKTLGGSVGYDDPLGHTKRVTSIVFTPDGQNLISCSEDETIRFWDVAQGQSIQAFRGYSNWFMSVGFIPHSSGILASGSNDGGIRLWNLSTNECLGILEEAHGLLSPDGSGSRRSHTDRVWCLDINSARNLLASGGDDGFVKLWSIDDIQHPRYLRNLGAHTGRIASIAFSSDGKLLATCSHDRTLNIWNTESGDKEKNLSLPDLPWSVAFHPASNVVATGGNDKDIKIWDVATGRCINSLSGHLDRIRCVTFSHDGKLLASCGDGFTVKIWDYQTSTCLFTLEKHSREVISVAFSPDDRWVASASYDKTLVLWDVSTGVPLRTLEGHTDMLWAVAFSEDGELLASCGQDETVRLWQLNTVKLSPDVDCKILQVKKPYEGLDLTGVDGLLPTQRRDLIRLGAFERPTVN